MIHARCGHSVRWLLRDGGKSFDASSRLEFLLPLVVSSPFPPCLFILFLSISSFSSFLHLLRCSAVQRNLNKQRGAHRTDSFFSVHIASVQGLLVLLGMWLSGVIDGGVVGVFFGASMTMFRLPSSGGCIADGVVPPLRSRRALHGFLALNLSHAMFSVV